MKTRWEIVGITYLIVAAVPAMATVITIDDLAGTGPGTGLTQTGTWASGSLWAGAVNGQYSWSLDQGATATYTPSNAAGGGFTVGTYDVYASWGVYGGNPGANTVTYTVNHIGGAASQTFNNLQNAAQSHTGSLPSSYNDYADKNVTVSQMGSGYRYLGTYSLDASSNVVVTGLGGGKGQIDAVMFRSKSDGRFLDPQSANLTTNDPSAWHVSGTNDLTGASGADVAPSGNYFYTVTDGVTAAWGGLADEAGAYDLKVSWGVYSSHANAAKYLVDVNGNGIQDGGDSLITLSQQVKADGTTEGSGVWSGWYDLGVFNLTGASQLLLWRDAGNGPLTVGPTLITPANVPEPSSLALFGSAAVVAAVCAIWRRR